MVEEMIQDLKDLMQSLPLYASKFMEMICAILSNYKDTCYAAYKSKSVCRGLSLSFSFSHIHFLSLAIVRITQSNSVSPIISATWAKDEDISRLLR